MNGAQKRYSFWYIAGPLLGYWLIQFGVQVIMTAVIEFPYMMDAYEKYFMAGEIVDAQSVMKEYMNALLPAMQETMHRQVEIAGAAALCTLPFAGILLYHDRRSERLTEAGAKGETKAPLLSYGLLLVFGAAGSIGASCLASMAQLALSDMASLERASFVYRAPVGLQIIVLGILIPVAEELMFRGLLFGRYRRIRGYWYAALWSTLFFVMFHTGASQMLYTLGLGLLLCYVYRKFCSIKAPIALHIAANLTSVLMTWGGGYDWIGSSLIRIAASAVIGAFICSVMFVLIQRMPEPERGKEEEEKETKNPLDMFR